MVARGEYLTRAADCEACHTAPDGRPFAGGRAFVLPFGALYSTNITPDRATGIGGYTDAQFIAMMRHGVRPDGERLYPAMPYASYALMRSEEHTSELQSLMRTSYAVFCLKKKKHKQINK